MKITLIRVQILKKKSRMKSKPMLTKPNANQLTIKKQPMTEMIKMRLLQARMTQGLINLLKTMITTLTNRRVAQKQINKVPNR